MYLAEGLLNSSDVSIEDTSKILADIFMHPLRDCCWRVKASTLLASRKIAEKRDKNDIILTEDCGSDRSIVSLYLTSICCNCSDAKDDILSVLGEVSR